MTMRTVSDVTRIRHALLGPGGRPDRFPADVRDVLEQIIGFHHRVDARGWKLIHETAAIDGITWAWPESRGSDDDDNSQTVTELFVLPPDELPFRPMRAELTLVGEPIDLPVVDAPREVLLMELTDDLLSAAEQHRRGDDRPGDWQ